ncbi:MAG: phosphodiester glycosidase family protein [Clostridiales bacterium]|nr:phosphodiester glycosidase family protein [Clostridiales bacterium]
MKKKPERMLYMRKLISLLLILLLFPATAGAGKYTITEEGQPRPFYEYAFSGEVVAGFSSDSLTWQIEHFQLEETECYLTKIWMADPGRQIGKATSDWQQNVMGTADIASRAPEASLLINASGYVSPIYSWIPENYPGDNSEYYFTPLGSVTVTNGETFRCLQGVPYYGLTLNTDGLRLHVGDDPLDVLSQSPSQTWSFYVECPVIRNYQSILDPDWNFTTRPAMRTIIAKMDANNYITLTVTRKGQRGLTMQQCVDFLLRELGPEWAYNLDGGPSSALMYRNPKGRLIAVWENGQENVDIMTFSQLPEDNSLPEYHEK